MGERTLEMTSKLLATAAVLQQLRLSDEQLQLNDEQLQLSDEQLPPATDAKSHTNDAIVRQVHTSMRLHIHIQCRTYEYARLL